MKKIMISAIMGIMAVCGMAQETPNTVVITKVGGETIKVAIEDVQDITFAYETPAEQEGFVDLGLSVKWATCNLGATSSTDAGWYLAWGETSPKTYYSWETYLSDLGGAMTQWPDAGTDKDPLKDYVYGGPHSEGIGATAYDAATAALGAGYRMPTQTEFAELANTDNCEWVWYDKGNTEFNGVAGYKVTSKKTGYTGNSIFLPAAGYRYGEDLFYEGSGGYYWSSAPFGNADDAYDLYFDSDYVNPDNGNYRCDGIPVRPVRDFTISDKADAYKTKHAAVLALDEDALTADDREPVIKALSDYSKLSSDVQALLADEKAKLDALKEAIPSGAPSRVTFVQLYENGPKWANMNIGATAVTDAGLYFWWGDVQGHAKDESPKFNFYSDNTAITSYGNNEGYVSDGKLVAEKDAATQLWGEGYRIPTQAEFEDLCDKCTWTWQTNYNGVDKANGYLVQGKGDYASKSIFIPAAGYRNGEGLIGEGSYGYYWSSTPGPGYADNAYDLDFDSDDVGPYDYSGRYNGFPVRPVSE